ncbi:hypothetical protein [Maribellus mangrovi]|uniref:hypothetical protein n=1 Tax=Maribellus mangrovi TaxID=3133146 RepID=UPI0030ED804F
MINHTLRIVFVILAILFVLCSCDEKKSKEELVFEQQKARRESVKNDLTQKYNISYSWDTLRFNYSIQFQDIIDESNHLITYFDIVDIFKENNQNYLFIEAMIIPRTYLKLQISDKLFLNMKDKLNEARFHRGFIVVKIREIKKIIFESKVELEGDDIYLRHETTNDFIGSGEIVDMVIL